MFEPGSLGDLVMLMPALKSLRERFPAARISLLCRMGGAEKVAYAAIDQASIETLLVDERLVDNLIAISVPWVDVSPWRKHNPFSLRWPKFVWRVRRLRAQRFDLAFAGGRSDIRANLTLWLSGARRRVGYGYAGGTEFLTDIVAPDMERPHQSELSLQLLEYLGVRTVRDGWWFELSAQDRDFAAAFFRANGIDPGDLVVGVHPGSRVPTRQWSAERFADVARRLAGAFGAKVIWFSETQNAENSPVERNIVPARFPLRQFLSVLSQCHFVLCNESGPMHLAAAVGVPSIAIFGSGYPEWFRAVGDRNRIVIRRDVPCRPCNDRCVWEEPYCLRLISVEQVMQAVQETLKTVAPASSRSDLRVLA